MSAVSTLPPALLEAFRSFAAAPEDAVEGALLVARVVQPDTDAAWCREELSRLAEDAGRDAGPQALVEALAAQGFGGAGERYHRLQDSVLEHVLRTRRGIPISLGVVVIGVAAHLGIAAAGVNFPRRFLVTLGELLVDPLEMAVTSEERCRAWLRRELGPDGAEAPLESDLDGAFRRAGPTDIAVRMLNNLRMLREYRANPAHLLAITDCQLILEPGVYSLRMDRADIWLSLGALDMARRELEAALELAGGRAKDHVSMRLKALPATSSRSVN